MAGTNATALFLPLWLITTKLMLPAMINLQLRSKVNELSKLELAPIISKASAKHSNHGKLLCTENLKCIGVDFIFIY